MKITMKKIILPIIFIFLIGFSVFVYAQLIEGGEYTLNPIKSVSLNKGWNLVSLYAFDLDKYAFELNDPEQVPSYIKAVYFYDRGNNEYIRLFPNFERTKLEQFYLNNLGTLEEPEDIGEYGAFVNSAIWMYSTKNKQITFSVTDGLASLDYVNIKQGWNFITVTPEFSGHSLNDLKGNCNILQVYAYDEDEGGWVNLISSMDDDRILGENAMQMHGLVMKVSDNCKLGIVEEGPPELPSDGDSTGNCTDSDGGKNYSVKGTTTGLTRDEVTQEMKIGTKTDTCVSSMQVGEWFCKSHHTYGEYVEGTTYTCPNGCLDGACI